MYYLLFAHLYVFIPRNWYVKYYRCPILFLSQTRDVLHLRVFILYYTILRILKKKSMFVSGDCWPLGDRIY